MDLFWAVATVVGSAVVAAVVARAIVESYKPRLPEPPREPGDRETTAALVLGRVSDYWPPPKDTRDSMLSLRRGDFVRWEATPPFDARLTDLWLVALRGSLDSVLAADMRHGGGFLFEEGQRFGGPQVYPLSWAAQNHPCWPAFDGVVMSPAYDFKMLLVAVDDVDLVLCPRWTRVPHKQAADTETSGMEERARDAIGREPSKPAAQPETPALGERAEVAS